MNPSRRIQRRILKRIWSLGMDMTEESLRAHLGVGREPLGVNRIQRYKTGENGMDVGEFVQMLHHLDGPSEVAAAASVLLEDTGCVAVVSDVSAVAPPDPADLRCLSLANAARLQDLTHAVQRGDTPAGAAELARDLRHMAALVDALGGQED